MHTSRFLKSTQRLPPFQSSLFGGVGVVEVTVGTVAAAVLIWGNTEPSHFGFLHAGRQEESGAASNAGLLLSLEMHWPARLPVKVEAARQDCRARPGHVTPPGGAARLIHPPPGEWKSTSRARRAGARAEGRKSTDRGAAENKDGPPAALRLRRPTPPPDPDDPLQRNLVFLPLHSLKFHGRGAGALFCFSRSLLGRAQARRANIPPRHWLGVHCM